VFLLNVRKAKPELKGVAYWEVRARKLGKLAVINTGYVEGEYAAMTEAQKSVLLPAFKRCLNGTEKVVLDFGCGPGRFTPSLAEAVGGKCVGVDPIASLLELAPRVSNVEYLTMQEGVIPVSTSSVDVVWICLVLGGIESPVLERTVSEINRVLNKGGLLFLVEDTPKLPSCKQWQFRSVEEYVGMFPAMPLHLITTYLDRDVLASVMAGRRV
jgi:ubiquinone/menaquinone biosynthesis C-methylase UbiE